MSFKKSKSTNIVVVLSFPLLIHNFRIHDEVPYSTLKCMINETSGVLENNFDKKSLCYFEVDDLNVESPIELKDLVKIMTNTEGIRVRYQVSSVLSTVSNLIAVSLRKAGRGPKVRRCQDQNSYAYLSFDF
jgi:hypothetical protein